MKKTELNSKYREYVKTKLSPTPIDRKRVSDIYESISAALPKKTLLIGSYARFTASRPLHDLDVLFEAGSFSPHHLSPQAVLADVKSLLDRDFVNPTPYQTNISKQSHSITISFLEGQKEVFAVDVVPAFTSGEKNSFGDDIYWVPEVVLVGRSKRHALYEILDETKKNEIEWWLKSDPRGYIRATSQLNSINGDFRKAAKFIKRWKHSTSAAHETFKLKSFHIEQVLFAIFSKNPTINVADSVFEFFCSLPSAITRPQIRDRADQKRFIDEYLGELSVSEKDVIIQARDFVLVTLENLSDDSAISCLLSGDLHKRASRTEEYLFDSKIPVFLERDKHIEIVGNVLQRNGGFRPFILNMLGIIQIDRKIRFEARTVEEFEYDLLKWKVKNDDSCPQPRGEITDHRTRNDPESTKYKGSHFVECYAIRDNVCVARARQNVVLGSV